MKYMKRLLGLVLAGAMMVSVLAGCGEQTTTPDPDDIAYQATGITRDTVLFTVDGADVTADDYLIWLLSGITEIQQSGHLATDEDWAGEIEGTPAAEYLKSVAMEAAILYSVVEEKAAEANVTLTEEEQAAVEAEIEQTATYLSWMGYTLQEYLNNQCISEAGFRRITEVYYLIQSYMNKLVEEGDERLTPTDEELTAFIEENGICRCQHILLAFPENEDGSAATDEQKAQTKAEADDMLAQIRAADDPTAKFEALMHEYSEDGRNEETGELGKPEGYTFMKNGYLVDGSTMLVTEFVNAGLALAEGEISEPVETDYGYHILMRRSADTEETRAAYPSYAMNDVLGQWLVDAEVETTEVYDSLDPKAFYDKMVELSETWAAEKQAQAEAEAAATATAQPEETGTETTEPPTAE